MRELWVGIDVGSTTVKIVVMDPTSQKTLFSDYQRHNTEQGKYVLALLSSAHEQFPEARFRVAFCGSAGEPFARSTGAFFIQEVVANTLAVKTLFPQVRVAIELGGQDAKMVFFRQEESTGQLIASDMRMNGSCAGGTGAFIDQIAELLHIRTEDFNALAEQGQRVYEISGRCGVFAKTDIQPLLNQGVSPADIALSSFHAIAKQTIGGLAQGLKITPPVIFEGGPLTFNPRLVEVFQERLALQKEELVIPQGPEILVALGAALATDQMYGREPNTYCGKGELEMRVKKAQELESKKSQREQPLFADPGEKALFLQLHPQSSWYPPPFLPGEKVSAYLGIDGGSTTTKFVLLDQQGTVIYRFYGSNQGDPLGVLKNALITMREDFLQRELTLEIFGVGSTGYGENLFATALDADFHSVETVAHAAAAQHHYPDVEFILDIGGQDMKAIFLKQGVVTGIILNEACSAGCGSFLETYAKSLQVPVEEIADLAFQAFSPSRLGSRCTVFMNSSIITEQKRGKTTGEILAGLCRSVVENVFTKVLRISNLDVLGKTILVQGGTFKNDAVLRAFEQYLGKTVIRPDLPGEMGAIGIALLTQKHIQEQKRTLGSYRSTSLSLDRLEDFTYETLPGENCPFCTNHCQRGIVSFGQGKNFVTGNRCEKGLILGDPRDQGVKEAVRAIAAKERSVPDLIKEHCRLLVQDYPVKDLGLRPQECIGIPRSLEFWSSLPYWRGVFRSLGYQVKVSSPSSYRLFEKGLANVPSDTVCLPAKLAHGHVQDLIEQGVDRIFFPMMVHMPVENSSAQGTNVCALVQGYPNVIAQSDEPAQNSGVIYDYPPFLWMEERHKRRQTVQYLEGLGVPRSLAKKAYKEGTKAQRQYQAALSSAGESVLDLLEGSEAFGVVLAGRPYHSDELINHDLAGHFTRQGIPVLSLDSLPQIHQESLEQSRVEAFNPFHTRMLSAALSVAQHPNLEMVQLVSFGCGHDAILSDEVDRILKEKGEKSLLVLKLDEGENHGPLSIRVKSYIETIRNQRKKGVDRIPKPFSEAFPVKFTAGDRQIRSIAVPNLSPAFSLLTANIIQKEGYQAQVLPLADERAFALGKKFVHNDICFPAQVNIGEMLAALERGLILPGETALGLSNTCEDCRAGHYIPLARKALDDAGYSEVPIITPGKDSKNLHPGFRLSPFFHIRMAWGVAMLDGLEMMVRALRPYEIHPGETDRVFEEHLSIISALVPSSLKKAKKALGEAVSAFNNIHVDRRVRKPRCGILGEILMNFHPTANGEVERYLESHGMEVVLPTFTDFFRRKHVAQSEKHRRGILPNRFMNLLISGISNAVFKAIRDSLYKILQGFKFYEHRGDTQEIMDSTRGMIDQSFMAGESWLMAGEILMLAEEGVRSFVILNPFGCLPNHVTGRGLIKPIKQRYPDLQILPLDFDPDTSFSNIENRLQMLVINAREMAKAGLG